MRSSEGTEALVALENAAPAVLFSTLPGTDTMLWPLLRWPLAQSTAEHELGTAAVARKASRVDSLRRAAAQYLPNRFASKRLSPRDLLIIAGGGTLRETEQGVENWLDDPFARVFPGRSAVLQDRAIPARPSTQQRPAFTDTFTFDDAMSRIEVRTKVSPLSAASAAYCEGVIREILRVFPYDVEPSRTNAIVRRMLYRLARIRHLNDETRSLLDRVNPRLILMDGASYGARSSMISIMKERDITVAEPQHGWIGSTHAAYNFGAAMSSPELVRTMPDALLTFGDFWSEAIRFPTSVIAVGKPHLENMTASLPEHSPRRQILIVSSVYETEKLCEFTLRIRSLLPPEWKIALRPHPSERARASELFAPLLERDGVRLDLQGDVYLSLSESSTVIGFASTVLYEALAFGCTVFAFESKLADLYIDESLFGPLIDSAQVDDALIERLTGSHQDSPSSTGRMESVWKSGAAANFRAFAEPFLDGSTG